MDRFEEMAVFVAAAEDGGLAAASRRLGVSAPTATRAINSLEARIGAPLLVRTTRSVTLTDVGRRYLSECKRILTALGDAEEHAAGEHAAPRGRLVATAPVMFGQMYVVPFACRFIDDFPEIRIDLRLSDRVLGLAEAGIDVALRIGELADSSMVAVRVGGIRRVVCAAPELLEQEGIPLRPSELEHRRIVDAVNVTRGGEWRFVEHGEPIAVRVTPVLSVNSNRAAIEAAERGFGLTRVLSYKIGAQLAAGTLQVVLAEFELPAVPVHLVYPQGRKASAKVRTFVDRFVAAMRAESAIN